MRVFLPLFLITIFIPVYSQQIPAFEKTEHDIDILVTRESDLHDLREPAIVHFKGEDSDGLDEILILDAFAESGIFSKVENGYQMAHPFPKDSYVAKKTKWQDVDGDGDLDVFAQILVDKKDYFWTLYLNEAGAYTLAQEERFLGFRINSEITGFPEYTVEYELIDLDHDGDLDLITSARWNQGPAGLYFRTFVSYFDGDQYQNQEEFAGGTGLVNLVKGDVNRDGYSDLIFEMERVGYGILYSASDFQPQIDTLVRNGECQENFFFCSDAPGLNWVGDINGDGLLEIGSEDGIVTLENNTLKPYLNVRDSRPFPYESSQLELISTRRNSDGPTQPLGVYDLALLNKESGLSNAPYTSFFRGGMYFSDYNNDGLTDIITSFHVFINNGVDLEDLVLEVESSPAIQIYPNPVEGQMKWKSGYALPEQTLSIRSLSGQLLKSTTISGQAGSLDLTSLSAGTYVLTVAGSSELLVIR